MQSFTHTPAPVSMQVVVHGSNAATQRPSGAVAVYWVGAVMPTNAIAGDLLNINGTLSTIAVPPAVGSPIAWFDFRQYDGSGILASRIGSFIATVYGTPAYTAGSNVAITGGSQYIAIPNDPAWNPDTTGSLTVIAITNEAVYGNGKTRWFASHRAADADGTPGWGFGRGSASPYAVNLTVRDNVSSQTVTNGTDSVAGYQAKAAIIQPAGSHGIVAGSQTTTAVSTVTGSQNNMARLILGLRYDNPEALTGQAHSNLTSYRGLLVYNSALTQAQITDYANVAGAGPI